MRLLNEYVLGGAAMLLVLGGCAVTDPYAANSPINESWGRAHAAQIGEQVADPSAPHNEVPAEGLDAQTAERVAKRYYRGQDSQKTRKAQAVIIGEID